VFEALSASGGQPWRRPLKPRANPMVMGSSPRPKTGARVADSSRAENMGFRGTDAGEPNNINKVPAPPQTVNGASLRRLRATGILMFVLPDENPVLILLVLILAAPLGGPRTDPGVPQSNSHEPGVSPRVLEAGLMGSSESYLQLGAGLERQRSWASAAAAYLAGTRCHGPLRSYCSVGLARCLLALGRPEEVSSLLDDSSLPAAVRPRAALLRAWAMLDQGAWEAALGELGAADELGPPPQWELGVAQALAWLGLELPDSARAVLLGSIRDDVRGTWAGRACRVLELIAVGPDSARILDMAAGLRERRGELDRAVEHWEMRARTGLGRDVPTARLALARVLRIQRKTAEARGILQELLGGTWRREFGCDALWELAGCALKDGDDAQIATACREYADRCPRGSSVPDAVWHQARALERLEDYQGARELYQVLGRSEVTDFGEECLFRQALCYYAQKDYQPAVALLDSLSRAYPGPRNSFWLAKVLERTGNVARAESCFVSAACHGPRPSYYSARAGHRVLLAGRSLPGSDWCGSADRSLAALVSASIRGDDSLGSVPWGRIRSEFERAEALLRLGMREAAAEECAWAVKLSDNHPVVRGLAIDVLERGMAYPQAMRGAYRWWREKALAELVERSYPRAYPLMVVQACRDAGVDSCLAWAVMREESWFEPEAVSRAGAVGLMQLMPHTAAEVAESRGWHVPPDLRDPFTNIRLGVAHLSDLLREFPFVEAALAAYNAGRVPARRWLGLARVRDRDTFVESITYGETRSYVQRVAATCAFYRSRSCGMR
jgi:soluble lytic murein transglycosylase-like protein/TolA-binding protein